MVSKGKFLNLKVTALKTRPVLKNSGKKKQLSLKKTKNRNSIKITKNKFY